VTPEKQTVTINNRSQIMAKKKSKNKIKVREFVSVKHEYSQAERNELTRQLTSAVQDKSEQNERLKSTSADFKARIKTAEAIINEATNKICNGYEMQNVEASVELDRKSGVKKLFLHAPGKKENKSFIREENMTEADYAKLPLEDAPPEKPKPDKKAKGKKKNAGVAPEPAVENAGEPSGV
jgi:seryl-tRNA synthetase